MAFWQILEGTLYKRRDFLDKEEGAKVCFKKFLYLYAWTRSNHHKFAPIPLYQWVLRRWRTDWLNFSQNAVPSQQDILFSKRWGKASLWFVPLTWIWHKTAVFLFYVWQITLTYSLYALWAGCGQVDHYVLAKARGESVKPQVCFMVPREQSGFQSISALAFLRLWKYYLACVGVQALTMSCTCHCQSAAHPRKLVLEAWWLRTCWRRLHQNYRIGFERCHGTIQPWLCIRESWTTA